MLVFKFGKATAKYIAYVFMLWPDVMFFEPEVFCVVPDCFSPWDVTFQHYVFKVFQCITFVAFATVFEIIYVEPICADLVIFVQRLPEEGTKGFVEIFIFYC